MHTYVLIIILGLSHTHSVEFIGLDDCNKAKTKIVEEHTGKVGPKDFTVICTRK